MNEVHSLVNVAWKSLTTRHRHLGVIGKKAAIYHPEVSMIAGVSENTEEAYTELASFVKPGRPVAIVGREPQYNHIDWNILQSGEGFQMIYESPIDYPEISFSELKPRDVPMMIELAELTKPGPFSLRTIEMGRYIGVKIDGKLVAMGGERMKPEGYTEISAICTHPDHRGKGYAKAITGILTNTILEQGETPFLNVFSDNKPAFNLYKKLGYKVQQKGHATVIMRK